MECGAQGMSSLLRFWLALHFLNCKNGTCSLLPERACRAGSVLLERGAEAVGCASDVIPVAVRP